MKIKNAKEIAKLDSQLDRHQYAIDRIFTINVIIKSSALC